jgi:hypothetical protein
VCSGAKQKPETHVFSKSKPHHVVRSPALLKQAAVNAVGKIGSGAGEVERRFLTH